MELGTLLSDSDYIEQLRSNITDKTHEINYYNPIYYEIPEDHGTLHVSTVDSNR